MTISKTIHYQTSDGEFFTDRHEAARHQQDVDIQTIIGDGKLSALQAAGYEVRKRPLTRAKKAKPE